MFTRKRIAAFVLVVLLCANGVILAVHAGKGPSPHPLAVFFLSIIAPVHDGLCRAGSAVRGAWNRYAALCGVERENERLRKEMARYAAALSRYNELSRENARLASELDFVRRSALTMRAARVVAGDPDGRRRSLVIDQGTAGGVRAGMAVVTPRGLVGRIVQTAPHYSRVLLITDPASALDARLAATRARGIVAGDPRGLCRMKYVVKADDVKPGDTVVTSGMDRLFAPGLDVGAVLAVSKDEAGMFSAITVAPFVNFRKIEEVLVITSQEKVPVWDQS